MKKAFILLILLASCSPEKRLARLLKKHPELLKSDTVYNELIISELDTFYVKEIKLDTLMQLTTDTVRLQEDRLSVIYKIDTLLKKVYIDAKCAGDTIIKYDTLRITEKTVTKSIAVNKEKSKAIYILLGIIIALLFYILLRIIKKIIDIMLS